MNFLLTGTIEWYFLQGKTDMANSYTNILVQFIFSPKHRKSEFTKEQRLMVTKYIIGIAKTHNLYPIATYCMSDHVHVFLRLNSSCTISQTARELKALSSKWINQQSWMKEQFQWQTGYGAFSYSRWDREKIKRYVENQEEHHKKRSFKSEYRELLIENDIDFEEEYLFD